MKKKIFNFVLLLCLLFGLSVNVYAETSYGDSAWGVTFTADSKMQSSFQTADINDVILDMQPGDTAVITLALANKNSDSTDWYMTNQVIRSLEDSSQAAAGGAYTYILNYKNGKGEVKTLYSSDTVGGEDTTGGEGLHEASKALKDYFYLDTLKTGETGSVELTVTLDGETQGNGYQNTLADLQMNFAVQLNQTGNTSNVVKTGDESDMIPYLIAAGICGVLLLALGIYSRASRKKEEQ